LSELLEAGGEGKDFCGKLDDIRDIRNKISHAGLITREKLLKARRIILDKNGILSKIVNISKKKS